MSGLHFVFPSRSFPYFFALIRIFFISRQIGCWQMRERERERERKAGLTCGKNNFRVQKEREKNNLQGMCAHEKMPQIYVDCMDYFSKLFVEMSCKLLHPHMLVCTDHQPGLLWRRPSPAGPRVSGNGNRNYFETGRDRDMSLTSLLSTEIPGLIDNWLGRNIFPLAIDAEMNELGMPGLQWTFNVVLSWFWEPKWFCGRNSPGR